MSHQPYAPVVAITTPARIVLPGLCAGLLAAVGGVVGLAVAPKLGFVALLSLLVVLSCNADATVWLRRGFVAFGTAVAVYVVCALALVCLLAITLSSGSFG